MVISKEIESRIKKRLALCYKKDMVDSIYVSILTLINAYADKSGNRRKGWDEKDAMLITYADSILNNNEPPIRTLLETLQESCGKSITFVHLLPFFPYTSDDGFSVSDYRAIRPDLGTWGDVVALSKEYRLVFDAVINHVSQHSQYVRGYLAGEPAFKDFCISLPPETDTRSVLRTRNLPLLHDFPAHDGTRHLWTTFSRDQVDLNYANPKVLLEVIDILLFYTVMGASMIRLDAIPYMWKKLGTSCAHLPETHELIKLIRDVYDAAAPQVLLLTETNVPHKENLSYFGNTGDEAQMIYNFSLAPLIVWSFLEGDASELSKWAAGVKFVSPSATYLNITATHDGIGMRPTEGILSEEARAKLCSMAKTRGGDITGKRNSDGSVSPYELNLSYFDAINDPTVNTPETVEVARFLCAQAITFSFIGIPGIYVHSLFGSRNDYEGVKRTGRARTINRAQLNKQNLIMELCSQDSLRSKVFSGMKRLLEIRSHQTAFHPDASQQVISLAPGLFAISRTSTSQKIVALHNVSDQTIRIPRAKLPFDGEIHDLLSPEELIKGQEIDIRPYQVRWLT
ncbi:MAG: sugar phosphorylase [Fibrobacteres bacterium]|nr:sugar phosphorylase [Fibrobacterota bacterium]